MGLFPEVLKPVLLLSVLVFLLVSYFTSGVYRYGHSFSALRIPMPKVTKFVCNERKGQEDMLGCEQSVGEALIPVYLECMSPTNALSTCLAMRESPPAQANFEMPSCLDEIEFVTECRRETIIRELRRRGFTSTEIGRLPPMLGGGGFLAPEAPQSEDGTGGETNEILDEGEEHGHGGEARQHVEMRIDSVPTQKHDTGNNAS